MAIDVILSYFGSCIELYKDLLKHSPQINSILNFLDKKVIGDTTRRSEVEREINTPIGGGK